jgi:hypothetical protein
VLPEAPEVPPDVDDVPAALAPFAPQSFAAYCGSLDLRPAHFADLLFCPERVAAGVWVAFWCAAPLVLMWLCALSRPVDFEAVPDGALFEADVFPASPLLPFIVDVLPAVSVEVLDEVPRLPLAEPLAPTEPEVAPLLPMEAPLPLIEEPLFVEVDAVPLPYVLPLVEPLVFVPLLWVVVALVSLVSFLCFRSPMENAEPLARAMMEVTTNAGASLRILPPDQGMCGVACGKLVASAVPRIDALVRGSTPRPAKFLRSLQKKCRPEGRHRCHRKRVLQ